MSVVSKDVIFHVKFDLEGAKKQLDKQKAETGSTATRGVPAKQEAKLARGGNRAQQNISNNLLNKHMEKKNVTEILKNQQPISRHQPKTDALGTGTFGTAAQTAILSSRGKAKLGGKSAEIEEASALKLAARRRAASTAKQVAKAEGIGLSDLALLGAKAVAGIGAIKIASDMAKTSAQVGAAFEGMLTEFVNDDPKNRSAIARKGLGYAGAKASEYAYRGFQWAKANVASIGSPFFLPERPVSAHGYNLAMAASGRKNIAFTGFLGGENIGTLSYDLQQEQDLLDFSRDRGMAMKAGRAYGEKFTAFMKSDYKGITDFLGMFIKGR